MCRERGTSTDPDAGTGGGDPARTLADVKGVLHSIRRWIDTRNRAVVAVRNPDGVRADSDGVRPVAYRNRRRDRIVGRLDPGERAVDAVRHPDGPRANGDQTQIVAGKLLLEGTARRESQAGVSGKVSGL